MATPPTPARRSALAFVVVGALAWGLYWVPIRWLESLGVEAAWAGVAATAGTIPAAFALLIIGRREDRPVAATDLLAAIFCGSAVALYGIAIVYTDVVRAVLLFYLTPIWSIAIEMLFLGRRWSNRTALAVLLAFVGLFTIFRGELPLDGLGARGDWMALAAGVSWSIGTALVFVGQRTSAARLTGTSLIAAAAISLAIALPLSLLDGAAANPIPSISIDIAGASFVAGSIFLAAVMYVTLWGTTQFNPVTIGFILTAEIISGVGTSALFLGERFGLPELIGTVLIIAGAVVEVTRPALPSSDERLQTT
ncbi:MAG: DMT family transporter [Pseudomonadota bacterium]